MDGRIPGLGEQAAAWAVSGLALAAAEAWSWAGVVSGAAFGPDPAAAVRVTVATLTALAALAAAVLGLADGSRWLARCLAASLRRPKPSPWEEV